MFIDDDAEGIRTPLGVPCQRQEANQKSELDSSLQLRRSTYRFDQEFQDLDMPFSLAQIFSP